MLPDNMMKCVLFATDVLGGYLFGGGWFGFSVGLYLKLRESGAPD
jgi:membrane-associated phospholipid phosphatase